MKHYGSVTLLTYPDSIYIRTYAFYTSASTRPLMSIVDDSGRKPIKETLQMPHTMYKYGDVELDLEMGTSCVPISYGRISKNWRTFNPVWHTKINGSVTNSLFTDYATGDILENVGTDSTSCSYIQYDVDKVTPLYQVNKTVSVAAASFAGRPFKKYIVETANIAMHPKARSSWNCEIGLGQTFSGTYNVLQASGVWIPHVKIRSKTGKSWPSIIGPGCSFVARDNSFESAQDARAKASEQYSAFVEDITSSWDGVDYIYMTVNRVRVSTTGYTKDQLAQRIANNMLPAEGLVRTLTAKGQPYSVLAGMAMSDIGMANNNGMAYLKDTARMGRDLSGQATNLGDLVNKMRTSKAPGKRINAAVRLAATTYLSLHYGWRLQAEDTREYKKALDQAGRSFGITRASAQYSGSYSDWNFTQRYSLFYDTVVDENHLLEEFLKYVDLWPTTENAWDMVPYSFVIDWFLGIGDALNSLDNYYHVANKYRIIGNIRTMTAWRAFNPFKGTGIQCTLQQKVYARGTYHGALTPSFIGDVSTPSKFNHYLEGGSLIVQRIP